ncbi:hypothetical protein CAEBREN_12720 [Caenorhabditis brenneri]|uniref:Uncharacterized protein n=1 Tax=Caenorhabditis brenneri TaxID=135651 RepID=G0MWV8_CAEBE|nr:hypothetical protein CAEBREN_12720 [Caenorhabditis brenneri]
MLKLQNEVAGRNLVFLIPLCFLYLFLLLVSNVFNGFYLMKFIMSDRFEYSTMSLAIWAMILFVVKLLLEDRLILLVGLGGIIVYAVKMVWSFVMYGRDSLMFNYDLFVSILSTLFFYFAFIRKKMIKLHRNTFYSFFESMQFGLLVLLIFFPIILNGPPEKLDDFAIDCVFYGYFYLGYSFLVADFFMIIGGGLAVPVEPLFVPESRNELMEVMELSPVALMTRQRDN